jgi:hypothetical protein
LVSRKKLFEDYSFRANPWLLLDVSVLSSLAIEFFSVLVVKANVVDSIITAALMNIIVLVFIIIVLRLKINYSLIGLPPLLFVSV